jgi:all-trans-retinol 13,14-reductase
MTYDIIIIGGGLGGLTAGAKLAKEGKTVLLLEQHDRAGGCATTFKRKDFTMEVGLHEMDGMHPTDGKRKIFQELGVLDSVEFLSLPEFYRFKNDRLDLVMPHTRDEARTLLKEKFPDQSEGIDTYFERLMNARRINILERDQPDISVGKYLDSIFSNEDIKLFLLGNLGYFHDDPYTLSLRYFSIAEGSYFMGRANYIQGGSQKLSDKLVDIIRENGGKVLLSHKVCSIATIENKVTEVTFKNYLPGNHVEIKASAKEFIANAALSNIAEMLGGDHGSNLKKQIEPHNIGASLLTVYYGFSKPLKEIGNKYYSSFVYDNSVRTQKDILKNNHSDFSTRSFAFVDYSQVDAQLSPPDKGVGAVCAIDYTSDWENLSREDYKKKKKEVGEIFTKRLNKLIPGFKDVVEYVEVGTATTVRRYTLNPKGAVYGFAQNPNRVPLSAIDGLDNLHIASAWGKFGGGYSGAIYSGYRCAIDILRGK